MSRIKIVCRRDRLPRSPGIWPEVIPSMVDCSVVSVADDGTETRLTNIQSIVFRVAADSCASTAEITFFDVELDADAELHIKI